MAAVVTASAVVTSRPWRRRPRRRTATGRCKEPALGGTPAWRLPHCAAADLTTCRQAGCSAGSYSSGSRRTSDTGERDVEVLIGHMGGPFWARRRPRGRCRRASTGRRESARGGRPPRNSRRSWGLPSRRVSGSRWARRGSAAARRDRVWAWRPDWTSRPSVPGRSRWSGRAQVRRAAGVPGDGPVRLVHAGASRRAAHRRSAGVRRPAARSGTRGGRLPTRRPGPTPRPPGGAPQFQDVAGEAGGSCAVSARRRRPRPGTGRGPAPAPRSGSARCGSSARPAPADPPAGSPDAPGPACAAGRPRGTRRARRDHSGRNRPRARRSSAYSSGKPGRPAAEVASRVRRVGRAGSSCGR